MPKLTDIRMLMVTAFAALLLSACSSEHETKMNIRLAHSLDVKHPVHQALEFMNVRLGELSNNTMSLIITRQGN